MRQRSVHRGQTVRGFVHAHRLQRGPQALHAVLRRATHRMHLPDLRQRAVRSFAVARRAVGLCRVLQHLQGLLVPRRRAQRAAHLLAHHGGLQRAPQLVQPLHELPVVPLRGGMGMLRRRVVAGLLQVQQGLLLRRAAAIMVGQ